MNKPVVILGYGGHARVVLDVLQATGRAVAGILAPDMPVGTQWEGIPVLGDDDWTLRQEAMRKHTHPQGEGTQLMAGVIVQPGTVIGENVLLNTRVTVDHHCRIGAHVHVAPGAILCGEVQLAERVFIGAGAILIQGVAVGASAQVAAGATVVRNIAAGTRYIPGRLPIRIEEA
jgi:bifunctional N-acetylglucosamine-1-phosphate-uridyltransferase/glucosamine-1-phosphate-acetyltransferase GlmU-like protein